VEIGISCALAHLLQNPPMNFFNNMLAERIDMRKKTAWGVIGLTVVVCVFISMAAFAKTEKEPNNA